jgi:hypothetical protein
VGVQIEGGGGGDTGRRGGGEFADLAGDARHDAGKRRSQGGAFQPGQGDVDLRLRTLDVGGECIAVGLAGARFGTRILAALRTDKPLRGKLLGPLGVPPCVVGHDAGLAAAILAGGELAGGEFTLRGKVAAPQLQ